MEFTATLTFDLRAHDEADADHILTILASRLSDLAPGTVRDVSHEARAALSAKEKEESNV